MDARRQYVLWTNLNIGLMLYMLVQQIIVYFSEKKIQILWKSTLPKEKNCATENYPFRLSCDFIIIFFIFRILWNSTPKNNFTSENYPFLAILQQTMFNKRLFNKFLLYNNKSFKYFLLSLKQIKILNSRSYS